MRFYFVVLLSLLAACASQPPVSVDRFYALPDHEQSTGPRQIPLADSLLIKGFQATGLLQDRAIVYSTQSAPQTYLQHHYHLWVDSPARLVQRHGLNYFRGRQLAKLVTDDPTLHADLVVSGRLEHFDRQLLVGSSIGIVAMEVRVDRAGDDRPLLLNNYRVEIAAPSLQMEDSVRAFGQALTEIFDQVYRDLALKQKIGQDQSIN